MVVIFYQEEARDAGDSFKQALGKFILNPAMKIDHEIHKPHESKRQIEVPQPTTEFTCQMIVCLPAKASPFVSVRRFRGYNCFFQVFEANPFSHLLTS